MYVVCWIPTSAVHPFKWVTVIHILPKGVTIVSSEHFLWPVTFWLLIRCPEWRLNPGFRTQKKCPFPLISSVPSVEVTNIEIMWTFSRDQILCPLNGGVLKGRFHCTQKLLVQMLLINVHYKLNFGICLLYFIQACYDLRKGFMKWF